MFHFAKFVVFSFHIWGFLAMSYADDEFCPSNKFSCGNGLCISRDWVCDKEWDCDNGIDERHCSDEFHVITTYYPTWATETATIDYDYMWHLPTSRAWETMSSSTPTSTSDTDSSGDDCYEFRCDNQVCIPMILRCDGIIDCPDMSDEKYCDTKSVNEPLASDDCGGFRCHNQACIQKALVCNGLDDCGDLSDEKSCNATRRTCGEHYCKNGGSCSDDHSSQNYCRCLPGYEGSQCELLTWSHSHPSYIWIIILNCAILAILLIVLLVFGCRMKRNVKEMTAQFKRSKTNLDKACVNVYEQV